MQTKPDISKVWNFNTIRDLNCDNDVASYNVASQFDPAWVALLNPGFVANIHHRKNIHEAVFRINIEYGLSIESSDYLT